MSQKYTVFIVDDDKFLLDMYRRKFEADGAEVDIAPSSEEALAKLRGGANPDVFISDIIMPEIDGLELLKTIRQDKLIPDSTIIMLTNESDQAKIKQAEALGIKGYIVKATTIPTEVVVKVREIAGLAGK